MQVYDNASQVPLALAVFLASDSYDYNDDPYTISATTLLKPIRQIILPQRMPKEAGLLDLAQQMSNRIGAAVHDAIERSWLHNYASSMAKLGYPKKIIDRVRINPSEDQLKADPSIIPIYLENRLERKEGKWIVTGKYDFIGEGQVEDFKTASVFSYKNQVNYDKQTKQLSIYRWLKPTLITKDTGRIHHIFTDWKAGMVKTDPRYPPTQFHTQSLQLIPEKEMGDWIRNKLNLIEQHQDTPEPDLPRCTEEDLWRSDPVFKYYKNGDTTVARSTKNFDNRPAAMLYMSNEGKGAGAIKEVPGEVKACKYCHAFAGCTQKDEYIASGDLVL